MLRKLLLFLMLSWTMPCVFCQDSSQPKPLTVDEKRLILQQLMELRDMRAITLPELEAEIDKLKLTLEEKERVTDELLDAEAAKRRAVEVERDTYKSQSDFYRAAAAIKPRGGASRFFCKLFTLGIGACR